MEHHSQNEKNLIFIAIISSVVTCGLLFPIWILVLGIYFTIKAFKYKPQEKPKPKIILPDNSFAEEWVFEIRKVDD